MIDFDLIARLWVACVEIGGDISKRLARYVYTTAEVRDEDRTFILLFGIGTAVAFALGILFFGMKDTRAFVPPIWFFIYVWSYHPYVPNPRVNTLFGAWREDYLLVVIAYRVITVLGLLAGLTHGIPAPLGLTLLTLFVSYIVACVAAKYVEEEERKLAEQFASRKQANR